MRIIELWEDASVPGGKKKIHTDTARACALHTPRTQVGSKAATVIMVMIDYAIITNK